MAKAKKKKADPDDVVINKEDIIISKEDIMSLFKELEKQGIQIDYGDKTKAKKPKKKNKK